MWLTCFCTKPCVMGTQTSVPSVPATGELCDLGHVSHLSEPVTWRECYLWGWDEMAYEARGACGPVNACSETKGFLAFWTWIIFQRSLVTDLWPWNKEPCPTATQMWCHRMAPAATRHFWATANKCLSLPGGQLGVRKQGLFLVCLIREDITPSLVPRTQNKPAVVTKGSENETGRHFGVILWRHQHDQVQDANTLKTLPGATVQLKPM